VYYLFYTTFNVRVYSMKLYPLLLNPSLHVKVWGGRQLDTVMHKVLPTEEPYGEAWEMHETATVANGELEGRTLGEVLEEYGHDLIGPHNDPKEGFPLLAKLIDASDWLSVQVHPNDAQARKLENEPRGKTEAWYILAAEPGARLVIGVEPGTTPKQMAQAIRDNTLGERLVYADAAPGDVLFIRAGTIHAIGAGILVYEIQQSSDTTYRLYDWGRMGLDGKPRLMHIDKGTKVANLGMVPEMLHTGDSNAPVVEIVKSEYFTTLLYQLNADNGMQINLETRNDRFHILTCIAGQAAVTTPDGEEVLMQTGQTVLIPSSLGAYHLTGTARVLCSFQTEDLVQS
jgi:mannose-6-phosphate isomerase